MIQRCRSIVRFVHQFKYTDDPDSASGWFAKNLCRGWLLAASRTGLLHQAQLKTLSDAGLDDGLVAMLQKTVKTESRTVIFGGQNTTARVVQVAEYCVRRWPGDIIEIGSHLGDATRLLAEVAKRHGRRVIAVDPWMAGGSGGGETRYDAFRQNTSAFRDTIDVLRSSSFAPETVEVIRNRELAFAYVDGLHVYYAAKSDIQTVAHCHGLIAVDDVSYGMQVMLAMRHMAHTMGRVAVHEPPCKEGYILPARL